MSIGRGELVQLALGPEEANKVDFSIPQSVFDNLGPKNRENIAGWYYAPEAKVFGRLLTQSECWDLIRARLHKGELVAEALVNEEGRYHVGVLPSCTGDWPCLQYHAQRGEIRVRLA